jgi:type VI secretion system protein VasL
MKPDSESPLEKAEPIEEVKWVYVVHQENQPNGEDRTTAPVAVRQWKPFLPGCVPRWWFIAVAWGWASVQTRPLATQAFASLAPLPEVLTPVQQDALTLRYFTVHVYHRNAAAACPTG